MPFELKPRIKFHKNPLIEVVCQLTYVSPILGMEDASKLVNLHAIIKDKLPLFKKAKAVSLHVNADNQAVNQIEKPVYEFASIDEQTKITVDADGISCVTTNYVSKEVFFEYINEVYNALEELGFITVPFKRIGLRYKDVIQRSVLGDQIAKSKWSDLLRDSLTSIFSDNDFSANVLGTQSNVVIKLNDVGDNARMNANYGIVTHAKTQEECFIIDSDFYIEGVLNYGAASSFLSSANIKSRNFFQWCIKPRLYEALEPEDIK
jgi:uncharacterized protein (TIGR04255 family)